MDKDTIDERDGNSPQPNFNGAAIIDDDGTEIPITEEMSIATCLINVISCRIERRYTKANSSLIC